MKSDSGAGGTSAAAMRLNAVYHPFSRLVVLGLFFASILGILSNTTPEFFGKMREFIRHLDGKDPGFFTRITANTYTAFMLFLLTAALIYSLLQIFAANRDYRWFASQLGLAGGKSKPWRFGHWVIGFFTGRPRSLYAAKKSEAAKESESYYLDRLAMHRRYGMMPLQMPMRFFLWAFPMLGFLGTAIGLSNAIRLLPDAMNNSGSVKLEDVLQQLAFKFDTTILGIVSALLMMLLIQFYERLWEDLELLEDAANERSPEPDAGAVEKGDAATKRSPKPDAGAAARGDAGNERSPEPGADTPAKEDGAKKARFKPPGLK